MRAGEASHRIADFASNEGKLYVDGKWEGTKLLICGKEYNAWFYDTYIFDAIGIAARWNPDQVTYDRICHLRYWIRENIQHGHDLPYKQIRSMQSVKKLISKLIEMEYGDMKEWKESKNEVIQHNNKIFAQ